MKFLSFKRKVVFSNDVNFHDLKIFIGFISSFTKKEKEIRLERRKEEKKKKEETRPQI